MQRHNLQERNLQMRRPKIRRSQFCSVDTFLEFCLLTTEVFKFVKNTKIHVLDSSPVSVFGKEGFHFSAGPVTGKQDAAFRICRKALSTGLPAFSLTHANLIFEI
jgi:hypothetical protein